MIVRSLASAAGLAESSVGPVLHTLSSASPFVRAIGQPPQAIFGFSLYPYFFTAVEASVLLRAALWKLDRADSTRRRRRPRRGKTDEGVALPEDVDSTSVDPAAPLQHLFDGPYGFEEGHFDSVIHNYRESLLSTLPPVPALPPLLARLHALLPPSGKDAARIGHQAPAIGAADLSASSRAVAAPPGSTTHVLHLSPRGAILPHVDNIEASGGTIVGASLGASRILRLVKAQRRGQGGAEAVDEPSGWDVLLPSGSVYVQSGDVRYAYEHSVLAYSDPSSEWHGQRLAAGHRVSLMMRDAKA